MKIEPKSKEEVIADLIARIAELEENMNDLVVIVSNRDTEILEIKGEMAKLEEDLNAKILERDHMIRSQAEGLKILAEGLKGGVKRAHAATRSKDLDYIAKLLVENGYLERQNKGKASIIPKKIRS